MARIVILLMSSLLIVGRNRELQPIKIRNDMIQCKYEAGKNHPTSKWAARWSLFFKQKYITNVRWAYSLPHCVIYESNARCTDEANVECLKFPHEVGKQPNVMLAQWALSSLFCFRHHFRLRNIFFKPASVTANKSQCYHMFYSTCWKKCHPKSSSMKNEQYEVAPYVFVENETRKRNETKNVF